MDDQLPPPVTAKAAPPVKRSIKDRVTIKDEDPAENTNVADEEEEEEDPSMPKITYLFKEMDIKESKFGKLYYFTALQKIKKKAEGKIFFRVRENKDSSHLARFMRKDSSSKWIEDCSTKMSEDADTEIPYITLVFMPHVDDNLILFWLSALS